MRPSYPSSPAMYPGPTATSVPSAVSDGPGADVFSTRSTGRARAAARAAVRHPTQPLKQACQAVDGIHLESSDMPSSTNVVFPQDPDGEERWLADRDIGRS